MIGETGMIDVIAENKDEIALIITDHLPWDEESQESHFYILQDKLNEYLQFVDSGELAQKYNIGNRKIFIDLFHLYPFNDLAKDFIEKASPLVEKEGVTLRTHFKPEF